MSAVTNATLKNLFLFSCSFIFSFHSLSQSSPSRIYTLTDENRPVHINVIFKNHQGYIFVGTNNGLYKFDGSRFHKFYFDNVAYNDTVTAIFQDKNRKYWIGFNGGRIANLVNNKMVYLNPEEGTPQQKI